MTQAQDARSWRDHLLGGRTNLGELDRIRTALLDLIDIGPDEPLPEPSCPDCRREGICDDFPKCRHADVRTQDATAVGEGPDNMFSPTPKGMPRTGTSDPTVRRVIAREAQIQSAVTEFWSVVRVASEAVDEFDLNPTDEHGRTLREPPEPYTERTGPLVLDEDGRLTPSGKVKVAEGLVRCRRAVLAGHAWLSSVVACLSDRWQDANEDRAALMRIKALWLSSSAGALLRRLEPPKPRQPAPVETRPCECDQDVCPHRPGGCGNEIPVTKKKRTCGTCRNRKWQSERIAS